MCDLLWPQNKTCVCVIASTARTCVRTANEIVQNSPIITSLIVPHISNSTLQTVYKTVRVLRDRIHDLLDINGAALHQHRLSSESIYRCCMICPLFGPCLLLFSHINGLPLRTDEKIWRHYLILSLGQLAHACQSFSTRLNYSPSLFLL